MQTIKRRVVIKEELVALTGDAFQAAILNQMLYWVQRVNDAQKFIVEEQRAEEGQRHGWIYKSAAQLLEELMLPCSVRSLNRYLQRLVDSGWLERRRNPSNRWDRAWQYRPSLRKIQLAVRALGYSLDHFPDVTTPPDEAAEKSAEKPLKETRPRDRQQPRKAPVPKEQRVGQRGAADEKSAENRLLQAWREAAESIAAEQAAAELRLLQAWRDAAEEAAATVARQKSAANQRREVQTDDALLYPDAVATTRPSGVSTRPGVAAIPESNTEIKPKRSYSHSTTTTRERPSRKSSSGGRVNRGILEICDELGIYEPKRSQLARDPRVIAAGPSYVRGHADSAPNLGCAIWRMLAGWRVQKDYKPTNNFDWESIVHR